MGLRCLEGHPEQCEVFYTNDMYDIVVCSHPDDKWFDVYGVFNRITGVVEAFASHFPAACRIADAYVKNHYPRPELADADDDYLEALLAAKATGKVS